eukprot:SAG22_NODE_83_length_21704_cov_58.556584_7_plen_280_part_00
MIVRRDAMMHWHCVHWHAMHVLAAVAATAAVAGQPLHVGLVKQLMVDTELFEHVDGASITLNPLEVSSEPVVGPTAAWEAGHHIGLYSSLLRVGNTTRLYYPLYGPTGNPRLVAYAESADGLRFTKCAGRTPPPRAASMRLRLSIPAAVQAGARAVGDERLARQQHHRRPLLREPRGRLRLARPARQPWKLLRLPGQRRPPRCRAGGDAARQPRLRRVGGRHELEQGGGLVCVSANPRLFPPSLFPPHPPCTAGRRELLLRPAIRPAGRGMRHPDLRLL